MSYRVVLRGLAQQDLRDAREWYDQQREGLGAEFLAELDQVFERLAGTPLIYPLVYRDVRRVVVRRFPYLVYFVVHESVVRIVALLHGSRGPRRRRERGAE